jgi:hypothetical protein
MVEVAKTTCNSVITQLKMLRLYSMLMGLVLVAMVLPSKTLVGSLSILVTVLQTIILMPQKSLLTNSIHYLIRVEMVLIRSLVVQAQTP